MTQTGMISIKADKPYIDNVRALALRRGVTIGTLVREAMDAHFENDLNEVSRIFFGETGLSTDQKQQRKNHEASHAN